MNPYKIDIEKLKTSKEMTDPREVLKLRLVSSFLKIVSKMNTEEILFKTGLHKADLSRLRTLNIERFSIDRVIGLLHSLGHSIDLRVR